jgi:branched-chain amino acid transport system permease protein
MFELIFFSILNGLVFGMLLFMLSSGLTLIFGMMGVLNFAHAGFYMLGAYVAYTLSRYLGFWAALLIAPVLVGLLGALVERFGLRRVHRFGHVAELIFTFGVAIVIEEIVQLVWGRPAKAYEVPAFLDYALFRFMQTSFPAYKAFMLLISVAIFVFLFAILTRTRAGLIIQASLTHPGMVAVLGGLGSLTGAFVASLLIGIVQTFAVALDISVGSVLASAGVSVGTTGVLHELWQVTVAQVAPIMPYVLLVLILIIRPTGLFGTRET